MKTKETVIFTNRRTAALVALITLRLMGDR
ncbi:MAG: hypothetical protein ACI8UD_000186 [Planctomycetota bacterium]|jgi:hypothetical protein